jgi:hypothetical protein
MSGQAFGNVINAAIGIRHRQHVDQGACRIRDVHALGAAPDCLEAEQALLRRVLEHEVDSLRRDALGTDALRRKDNGLVEELFGQVPMVSGCSATDIALPE